MTVLSQRFVISQAIVSRTCDSAADSASRFFSVIENHAEVFHCFLLTDGELPITQDSRSGNPRIGQLPRSTLASQSHPRAWEGVISVRAVQISGRRGGFGYLKGFERNEANESRLANRQQQEHLPIYTSITNSTAWKRNQEGDPINPCRALRQGWEEQISR